MINEETLLKNGYKECKQVDLNSLIYRHCDKFYTKVLSKENEPTSVINVYYYDKFKEDGALDYDYEFEWVKESYLHWEKKLIYAIDKEIPLEEIENILLS